MTLYQMADLAMVVSLVLPSVVLCIVAMYYFWSVE